MQSQTLKGPPSSNFWELPAIFSLFKGFKANIKCWQCLESLLGLKCWKQYSFQHLKCQPNNMQWGTSFELHFTQADSQRLLHHITSILDFYIITVDTCTCHLLCQAIHAGPWLQTQLAYEKIADSSMIKGYVYFWKTWLAFQNQKQTLPAIFCQMTCGWNKGLNSMGHVIWTAFHTSWHSESLLTGNKAILRLLPGLCSGIAFGPIFSDPLFSTHGGGGKEHDDVTVT